MFYFMKDSEKKMKKAMMISLVLWTSLFGLSSLYAGDEEDKCQTKKCDVDVKVFPIPVLAYDKGRMIIREGDFDYEQTDRIQDPRQQACRYPVAYILNEGDCHGRHRVLDRNFYAGGIGVVARMISRCIPKGLGVGAAVIPMVGKKQNSERYVDGLSRARVVRYLEVPKKADDILIWEEGDTLQYATHGSLKLAGGIHYFGLVAGLTGHFQGEWGFTVKKLEDQKVQVTISNEKLVGASVFAGVVLVANASLNIDKIFEKDLVFTLDLSDEDTKKIFMKLIKGDLTDAQKIAEKEHANPHVKLERSQKTIKTEKSRKFHMGLPLIVSKDYVNGSLSEYRHTIKHDDQRTTEVDLISSQKSKRFKVLNNPFKKETWKFKTYKHESFHHYVQGLSFTSHVDQNSSQENEEDGNEMELVWDYKNDKTTSPTAYAMIEQIKAQTGFGEMLNVIFPHYQQLGYVGIQFKIHFNHQQVKDLLSHLVEDPYSLSLQGQKFVEDYFKKVRSGDVERNKFCVSADGGVDDHCVSKLMAKVGLQLKKSSESFLEIARHPEWSRKKKGQMLVAALKKAKNDPFALKALLSYIPGAKASYKVEGEKFLTLKKDYSFTLE